MCIVVYMLLFVICDIFITDGIIFILKDLPIGIFVQIY